MSRLDDTIRRDLQAIADRATPSPDAWNRILHGIDDQAPDTDTEIIMLTDNTLPTRRWPLLAAAAALVIVAVGAIIAFSTGGDDDPVPAIEPELDEEGIAPDPEPEPETVEIAPVEAAPIPLPDVLGALEDGRYSADSLGVPLTFSPPTPDDGFWRVQVDDPVAVTIGPDDAYVMFSRVGSFYGADQSEDPSITGLGSIPSDDIDGWIDANGVVVDRATDTTVGEFPAKFRQVRAPAGAGDGTDLCPADDRPCLTMTSASADLQSVYDGITTALSTDLPHLVWIVEVGEFEPLIIWSHSATRDPDEWRAQVTPFIESIEFGDPAPATDGGTARLPERVTVTGDMTITQTGEPNASEPWPMERVGVIVGDISGTMAGTGMSSPNGAEVDLEWVFDVTIDGLGSGTLTVKVDEVWGGDVARYSVDRVVGGTGDLEGVTGFGRTTHTDDGATFTADIELHLLPPQN